MIINFKFSSELLWYPKSDRNMVLTYKPFLCATHALVLNRLPYMVFKITYALDISINVL